MIVVQRKATISRRGATSIGITIVPELVDGLGDKDSLVLKGYRSGRCIVFAPEGVDPDKELLAQKAGA